MSNADAADATTNDAGPADAAIGARSSPRTQTTFRVARVVANGDEGLARLRDVSDHGVGLRLYMPVALGDRLVVQFGDTTWVTGHVVWTCAADCGIALDAPIDSGSMLAHLAREGRQAGARPLRLSLAAAATAQGERGPQHVELVDVSQRGVKFRHEGVFSKGLLVKLTLPSGMQARGIVRWSSDGLAGLMLLEPLSVESLGSVRSL